MGLVLCVLLCSGIGKTAQAAESKTYNGFMYEESEITITGYVGDKTEVVIPGEINGKKVTTIGDKAFGECTSLTGVTIPEGVTGITKMHHLLYLLLPPVSLHWLNWYNH